MLIPVLGEVTAPEDEGKRRNWLGLNERPQLLKLFVTFLTNYLLLPYGSHPSTTASDDDPYAPIRVHPCLSEDEWKRVSGEKPIKAEQLVRCF